MNEAETRAEHIDPALNAAGWGVVEGSKMLREYTPGITFDPLQPSDGRLVRIRCIARSLQVKFRVSCRRCNFLPLLAGHTSSGQLLWLGDFSQ